MIPTIRRTNLNFRTTVSYAILFTFLVSILWTGLRNSSDLDRKVLGLDEFPFVPSDVRLENPSEDLKQYPDFSHIVPLRTITDKDLALYDRRLIFVGDIHGMKSSIDALLSRLSYNSSHDLLVHLGDLIAKGLDSLEILSQFADAGVAGVRGNHEQYVIEWRAWIEWVESWPEGRRWLEKMERKYPQGFRPKHEYEPNDLRWPIPAGWKFMADHYKIARYMTKTQYSYLKSLPLVIHLPSINTFVVHAGILPFDPRHPADAPGQPLSYISEYSTLSSDTRRIAQQKALLTDIEQNTVPWVLLNVRSILKDGEVSRFSRKGKPWVDLWNMVMDQCRGFYDLSREASVLERQEWLKSTPLNLSCLPINVVYGHAASRGLDIKRWSFGLDTGCVKGKQLTAMVLSSSTEQMPTAEINEQMQEVPFGDSGMARLFSIHCSK